MSGSVAVTMVTAVTFSSTVRDALEPPPLDVMTGGAFSAVEGVVMSANWKYSTLRIVLLPSGEPARWSRSEEHTSELQSLMRISYAVFCLITKTYDTREYK